MINNLEGKFLRLLMIGDIVGRSGRRAVKETIPLLQKEGNFDFVIANGENAAGGLGITRKVADELFSCNIDVITMGNHVWRQKEIHNFISREERLIRPANFPPGVPGVGCNVFLTRNNLKIAVINLAGRTFMPVLDCPFRKANELLLRLTGLTKLIVVDFHAEATSEKVAMGWHLAGQVSAVCGTHTHVQTADERILYGGTAYISDIGMTGPRDSVIGVKKELAIEKFLSQIPQKFEVATGSYQFNAVIIEIDPQTGKAQLIKRIQNYE